MTEIDPKLSRLYREASAEGPPAALDAAILAAARKQVAKPRRRARSAWVRWMAPAGALATLALAVSLAFLVERERPGTIDDAVIREIPPRPQSAPPARVTGTAKSKAADSAAPAAATKKEAPAAAAPAEKKDASAATAPAQKLRSAEPAQAPAPAAPSPAPAAPAQAPLPQPAAPAPPSAQAFPAESRAKTVAPGAVAPKAATESNVARDSVLGGAGAAAPAAPAAAGKLAPMRQQAIQRSPEAWLEEISRLRREGREKDAAEQLAEFRKAYPAYAVPESLRSLQ